MWADGKPITEYEQAIMEFFEDFWAWLLSEVKKEQMETHDVYHFNTYDSIDNWLRKKREYYEKTPAGMRFYQGLHRKVK